MSFTDRYGQRLKTTVGAAADAYGEGLDRLLAYLPDAAAAFRRAAEADDDFALPHSALAYLAFAGGDREGAAAAASEAVLRTPGATRRESQQAHIVAARVGGDDAFDRMIEHLAEFPADALVLRLAVFAIGFGGRHPRPQEAIHALLRTVAPAYGDDDWWFPGVLAMSHQELGELDQAGRLARRALERHPGAGSAAHPLSHVLYERGDAGEGVGFLAPWLADYPAAAPLRCHLAWHLALFELARGDLPAVERLLAEEILAAADGSFTALEDGASLLWRRRLAGHDPRGLRWEAMTGRAGRVAARPGFAFLDAHAALAFAGAGDAAALARLVDGQRELAARGHPLAELVVMPVAEGLAAFVEESYAAAAARLEQAQPHLARLGGTRAQREVFEDTLLVAWIRAGRADPARRLLTERLGRRGSPTDERWLALVGA